MVDEEMVRKLVDKEMTVLLEHKPSVAYSASSTRTETDHGSHVKTFVTFSPKSSRRSAVSSENPAIATASAPWTLWDETKTRPAPRRLPRPAPRKLSTEAQASERPGEEALRAQHRRVLELREALRSTEAQRDMALELATRQSSRWAEVLGGIAGDVASLAVNSAESGAGTSEHGTTDGADIEAVGAETFEKVSKDTDEEVSPHMQFSETSPVLAGRENKSDGHSTEETRFSWKDLDFGEEEDEEEEQEGLGEAPAMGSIGVQEKGAAVHSTPQHLMKMP